MAFFPGRECVVGLGSNLGSRGAAFCRFLQRLRSIAGIQLLDTSFCHASAPVLVREQPRFLNAAIRIKHEFDDPEDLLTLLQSLEHGKPTNRYGPRELDLDMLLLGNEDGKFEQRIRSTRLEVPHPRIAERAFVLIPLLELGLGDVVIESKGVAKTVQALAEELASQGAHVTTRSIDIQARTTWENLDDSTRLMGILNVTPDSFSDGGEYYSSAEAARIHALEMVAQGAEIVDVGGESTRPGAEPVEMDQELKRVIPVLKALRSCTELNAVPISIDTNKAGVAREAIAHGADIINDVSGGNEELLQIAAEFGVPIILMHNRGNSKTMNTLTDYVNGVTESVCEWLQTRIEFAITKYGIPRWNIWIDPGFGFAKTGAQNYEMLNNLERIVETHPNLLVGASRKRFIRSAMKFDQDVATAATTALAARAGANIIRVHNVKINADVVAITNAMKQSCR